MKARIVAVALFATAAVLWGGMLALFTQTVDSMLAPTAYAVVASAIVAAVLAPWLSQRAEAEREIAGGIFDGAGLMALAYVTGTVLMSAHNEFLASNNDFLGILAVGLIAGAFLLPPALVLGGLAGLAFRAVVIRGDV